MDASSGEQTASVTYVVDNDGVVEANVSLKVTVDGQTVKSPTHRIQSGQSASNTVTMQFDNKSEVQKEICVEKVNVVRP